MRGCRTLCECLGQGLGVRSQSRNESAGRTRLCAIRDSDDRLHRWCRCGRRAANHVLQLGGRREKVGRIARSQHAEEGVKPVLCVLSARRSTFVERVLEQLCELTARPKGDGSHSRRTVGAMMWGSAGQRLCVCIDGVGEREGRGQVRLSGLVRSRLLIFAASMLVSVAGVTVIIS